MRVQFFFLDYQSTIFFWKIRVQFFVSKKPGYERPLSLSHELVLQFLTIMRRIESKFPHLI